MKKFMAHAKMLTNAAILESKARIPCSKKNTVKIIIAEIRTLDMIIR